MTSVPLWNAPEGVKVPSILRAEAQPIAQLAEMTREEWLAERRHGIGASDAPAIANVDRFRSPYAVWAEKVSDEWPEQDSPAMEWGNLLEPAILAKFKASNPSMFVRGSERMYAHPEIPYMRCTPDGTVWSANGFDLVAVVQIKTSSLADEWRDGPPDRVVVQVQHEMEVMGCTEAWVPVLLNGRDYRTFHLTRDDELVGHLLKIEAEFWRRVIERDPPPIDGHGSTTDAIRALHASVKVGTERVLPDDAHSILSELYSAKRLQAEAEAEVTRWENELKALLGDAEIGVLDGREVVTWKATTSNRLDTKALKAAHPDLASEFTSASTSRRFLVKGEQ